MHHIDYYEYKSFKVRQGFVVIRSKMIFQLKYYCKHHQDNIQDQGREFRKQAAGPTVFVLQSGTNPAPSKLDKLSQGLQAPSPLSEHRDTQWFSVHENSLGKSWGRFSLVSAFTWVLGNVSCFPHSSFQNTTFPQGYSRAVPLPISCPRS